MTTITPLSGQSIFDIALMKCGVAEAVYDIARSNNISITDNIEGMDITVGNTETNKKVVEYYTVNKITPATDYLEI